MSSISQNKIIDLAQQNTQIVSKQVSPKRANMDVLRRRLSENQKKEKFKTRILASTICVSIGVVTFLVS